MSYLTCLSAGLCFIIAQIGTTRKNCFPRLSQVLAFIWAAVFTAAAILVPGQSLSAAASLVVLGSLINFFVGHYIGEKLQNSSKISQKKIKKNVKFIFYILACVSGIISINIYIYTAGETITGIITEPINAILKISQFYTFGRYADPNFQEPRLAILFSIGLYLSSLIGGDITASASKNLLLRLFGLFPILLATLTMLLLTTRATLIYSLAMWASAFIAKKCILTRNKWTPFKTKRIISLLLIIIILSIIYISIQGLRRQSWTNEDASDYHQYMLSALLGSPTVLSKWLLEHINQVSTGSRLISGPLQIFGFNRTQVKPVPVGTLDESASSNIISLFGDAINDLGVGGSQILMMAFGVAGGFAWKGALLGKLSSSPILAAVLFLIILSPLGSPYAYTTICASFLIYSLIYWLPAFSSN